MREVVVAEPFDAEEVVNTIDRSFRTLDQIAYVQHVEQLGQRRQPFELVDISTTVDIRGMTMRRSVGEGCGVATQPPSLERQGSEERQAFVSEATFVTVMRDGAFGR